MVDPFLDTVAGYGDIVAVFRAAKLVHVGRVGAHVSKLDGDLAETFAHGEYAQLVSRHVPHLYRSFDSPSDDPPGPATAGRWIDPDFAPRRGASMLGQVRGMWLTPMRPTCMEEVRCFTAVKHDWNRSDAVLDDALLPGARIYVGRAGRQTEVFRGRRVTLAGGAVQVFVPRDQVTLLRRNTVWVVK